MNKKFLKILIYGILIAIGLFLAYIILTDIY